MASRSIPSRFLKRAAKIAGGTLLCVALFAYAADLWAQRKLPFIESTLSGMLHRPVTVESAHFSLFSGILLNGIELKQFPPFAAVRIRRLCVMPSFRLFPPTISVRRVRVIEPQITVIGLPAPPHAPAIWKGLSGEWQRIGVLRVRSDIESFEIKNAKINFSGDELSIGPVSAALSVNTASKDGEMRFKLSAACGAVKLKGEGSAEPAGMGRWHLSIASERIPLERLRNVFPYLVPDSGTVQFFVGLRGRRDRIEPLFEVRIRDGALHDVQKKWIFSNLSGQLLFSRNEWTARELWGFVNGLPLRADIRKLSAKRDRFYLDLSTYPGQSRAMKAQHSRNGSFRISAARSPGGWGGYARFRHEDYGGGKKREDVWTASFRGLEPDQCRFLRIRRLDGIGGASLHLFFRRLVFFLMANERYLHAEIIDTSLKQGRVRLKTELRYATAAWKAALSLEDLDAEEWLAYMKQPLPVRGRLNARASWTGVRDVLSEGHMDLGITNGHIGPSDRLDHWAKDTGIEALKDLRFEKLSVEADQSKEGWDVKKIDLSGKELNLAAHFKTTRDRISGVCSVRFPASSISDSSDLKWLLRFVGVGDWVDFDFKIAGYAASPRVFWQGGDFKKKLESHLMPWMRNEFSRQVEEHLMRAPASENSQA